MKRLCFILLFQSFQVLFLYGTERVHEVLLNFEEKDFAFETSDAGLSFCGSTKFTAILSGDTLAPALPMACINILIGPNEELMNFSYDSSERSVLEKVKMAPNPWVVSKNDTGIRKIPKEIVFADTLYPQEKVQYTGRHSFGGFQVLTFLVFPYCYDALNQQLKINTNLTLHLNLSKIGNSDIPTNKSINRSFAESVKNMVVNPSDMEKLYVSLLKDKKLSLSNSDYCKYLIITCDSLKDSFLPLAKWKTEKGMKAKIITVEDIYANDTDPLRNDALKVKYAIKQFYDSSNGNQKLEYVLLGGLGDIVPTQKCYVYENNEHNIASSDLFYACLNTMDWDTNHNEKYGDLQDNVSLAYNVVVTRLPVRNSVDVHNITQKIIRYEKSPNAEKWKNEILMCAVENNNKCLYNGDLVSIFHASSERMYSQYIEPSWTGSKYRFYDSGTDNYSGADYNVTSSNLQSELAKNYAFVNIDAHGNVQDWELENDYYTYMNAASLNSINSSSSIVVTEACNTNCIDASSNTLGCVLMRNPNNGIVAYYGSIIEALGFSSGNLGPIDNFCGSFYESLFFDGIPNIGKAVYESKKRFIGTCNSSDMNRYTYFFLFPFCDPEMPVYTCVPKSFPNNILSLGNSNFTIYSADARSNICIMDRGNSNSSHYDYLSNVGGDIVYNIDPSKEYLVTLTRSNYIPFQGILAHTVHLQNESMEGHVNVLAEEVYIGSSVTDEKEQGPVCVNCGKTIIQSTEGVKILNNFKVKLGASLEIKTN